MYYIYILTNKYNTTFYIGVTNNIARRLDEHGGKHVQGFTNKYNLTKLVYFEEYTDIREALQREKQLKNWHREWKMNLIKVMNPKFKDLMGDPETSSG
ncbi:MAG: GIY-YIG nuclease family protein [Candidatus Levybacteria bacterium]|nr:GIY-YIG nuclease family protein [Candidatus Levybacteria bacterium]